MMDESHEMLINKDTKGVAHSLTARRIQKFESICRFLPFRATILSNLKKELSGLQKDMNKGYSSS